MRYIRLRRHFGFGFVLQIVFVSLLVGATVGSCFGQEEKSDYVPKIVFRKDAESGAGYRKNRLEFFLKLIKLYEKNTKDGGEFRQRAKQYLRSSISFNTDQVYREDKAWKPHSELFETGKKLLDDGCRDPLVLLFHAKILNASRFYWEREGGREGGRNLGLTKQERPIVFLPNEDPVVVARLAMKQFEGSGYPRGIKILFLAVVNNAIDGADICDSKPQVIEDDLKVLDAIPEWIGFVRGEPDWERIAYSVIERQPKKGDVYRDIGHVRKESSKQRLDRIEKLGEQKVLSDWLYQMMLADHHNTFPRCDRIASEPYSESYRKVVLARIPEEAKQSRRLAAKHYRAAYEIASQNPESSAHLIMLAYEEYESDDRWTWFQRAIDAEVDNPSAYHYLILTSDRLASEAVVKLAYQFFESGRFDTDIPSQFLSCLKRLNWYESRHLIARNNKFIETVEELLLKYAQEDGLSVEDSMLSQRQIIALRRLVKFASKAKRFDIAVKYSQLLDQMSTNWFARAEDRVFLRSMVHARNNHSDELRDIMFGFDGRFAEGWGEVSRPRLDISEAAERYQELSENCDPLSAPYLKTCAVLATQLRDYDQGKWINLCGEFPADYLWGLDSGNFLFKDGGIVDLSNNPKGRFSEYYKLLHKGDFVLPREIQCSMNLLTWKGRVAIGVQPGRGFSDSKFMLGPRDGLAGVLGRLNGESAEKWVSIPSLQPRKPARLIVRVWDKENFQYFVDGLLVDVGELELEKLTNVVSFVGASRLASKDGADGVARAEVAVRVSNVRVRKLPFSPPPKRDQPEKGLEYFTEAIDRSPDLAVNYLRRGDCNDQLGNIKEAISDFRKGLQKDSRTGRDRLRFVQLCLSTKKYAEAHRHLSDILDQLQGVENELRAAEVEYESAEGKIQPASKWRIKRLFKVAPAKTGIDSREQLQATIANLEDQLLFLHGTCPDDDVRSSELGEELLKTTAPKTEVAPALRYLARAYVEAELKQYERAAESLTAAKKAAGDSEEILKEIEDASKAIENQMPIRLKADQIVVLKDWP